VRYNKTNSVRSTGLLTYKLQTFWRALKKSFLRGWEPRLRGLNHCYSIPERVGRDLSPPDFCTFSETSIGECPTRFISMHTHLNSSLQKLTSSTPLFPLQGEPLVRGTKNQPSVPMDFQSYGSSILWIFDVLFVRGTKKVSPPDKEGLKGLCQMWRPKGLRYILLFRDFSQFF